MTVLVAERKFSVSLGTFSNHLIMKQTEITTNILLFFWFLFLLVSNRQKGEIPLHVNLWVQVLYM